MDHITQKEEKVQLAIEIAIKLGLLAIVLYVSYLIAKPFISIVVWGIIIAVAIFPLIHSLEKRFGNRKKVITGFTVSVIAALLIPTYMLSDTVIKESQTLFHAAKEGKMTVPPPTEKVKEWPLIGEKLYTFWDAASHNLQQTLSPFRDDIKKIAEKILLALGSGLGTVFMFIGSFIIAAALLMVKDEAVAFYLRLLRRIVGNKDNEWAVLTTLTIRSVVTGVIGVAAIQAALALIGLILMGVPFAVILSITIMFLTIIQLPAFLIIGPVIVYVFSQGTGTAEIVFTIYMLIVGMSDSVLKPMLMGRGIDIPMLVILIGAIGGMMLMGMIGLFIGAVIFTLTYKLLVLWMNEVQHEAVEEK